MIPNTSHKPNACDLVRLNLYLDGELEAPPKKDIELHLQTCPSCQTSLAHLKTIDQLYRRQAENAHADIDFTGMQQNVLAHLENAHVSFWDTVKKLLGLKSIYIPVVTACACLIVIVATLPKHTTDIGPSAIVNSIDGDVSSVMIFETEKSKKTIIWFNETS